MTFAQHNRAHEGLEVQAVNGLQLDTPTLDSPSISEARTGLQIEDECQSELLASDSTLKFPKKATHEQIFRGRRLAHSHLNAIMELARKQRHHR